MILTKKKILDEVINSRIIIRPFLRSNLNPNSYNYTLGKKYCILDKKGLGDCNAHNLKTIPKKGLLLMPRVLYLMHTHEIIGSHNYVVSLIGRSSMGRLGLFLTLSADLGNLGKAHKWTLEVYCVQPIMVYSGMKIGQVSFWKPRGEITKYIGNYSNYNLPKTSIL